MEKDIVVLSIGEYNQLRDFKKDFEENAAKSKFPVIRSFHSDNIGTRRISSTYCTESEALIDFENKNKELTKKVVELESKVYFAKTEKTQLEYEINDLQFKLRGFEEKTKNIELKKRWFSRLF